jgi:flavin reductase (DIM6/NTAB) family NADH-FMN oxidoreductase RutF
LNPWAADGITEDVDGFEYAGLKRQASEWVCPPRVAGSLVQYECSLYDVLEIYDREIVPIEAEHFHVDEAVQTDGKIDMVKLDTVGCLSGQFHSSHDPVEHDKI